MESCADDKRVGVIGATSLVGSCLLPLLARNDWNVTACTRGAIAEPGDSARSVVWESLAREVGVGKGGDTDRSSAIAYWICLAPIWVLPEHFAMLARRGTKRIVALSSTSRFTKSNSPDPAEQMMAQRLRDGEIRLETWAREYSIELVILRPTLVYGLGRDKNICVVARFIRRFGFFPLLASAQGLRQPVHAQDVAAACLAALEQKQIREHAYNLSGGETLTYRSMVERVFAALGKPARFLRVPAWLFFLGVGGLRLLPRFQKWTPQMARRMNTDLVFSHADAARDLSFAPRPFALTTEDLPQG